MSQIQIYFIPLRVHAGSIGFRLCLSAVSRIRLPRCCGGRWILPLTVCFGCVSACAVIKPRRPEGTAEVCLDFTAGRRKDSLTRGKHHKVSLPDSTLGIKLTVSLAQKPLGAVALDSTAQLFAYCKSQTVAQSAARVSACNFSCGIIAQNINRRVLSHCTASLAVCLLEKVIFTDRRILQINHRLF